MRPAAKERFMAKVEPEPNTGCWLWKGYVLPDGYGTVSIAGKRSRAAHRVSWELFRGEIPPGMLVCHRCDVRACVNPEHLFLGSLQENAADMKRKGRSRAGESNPAAKLKAAEVREIKAMMARPGFSARETAARFGVSPGLIYAIRKGKAWARINAAQECPSFDKENSMSDFQPAIAFVLQHEDPARSGKVTEDAGGRTRFGIAEKFHPDLPEDFFTGPADQALQTAEEILRRDYWDQMRLSQLASQNLANKIFDMGVNMGVHQAAIYVQRAVNGLLGAQSAGPDQRLVEDGVVGEKTLAAINRLDPIACYRLLCEWSRIHYCHVAAVNPAQAVYLNGWLKRAEA